MEIQKCYFASFNIGTVEVYRTEFYIEKEAVFLEIEETKDEIAERICDFSVFVDEETIKEVLEYAIADLKEFEVYEDKKRILIFSF